MSWPTPYTVGWHSYSAGAKDAHNRSTAVYSPPKDQSGTPVDVCSIAPPGTDKNAEPEAGRVVTELELLAPPGLSGKAQDVVDITTAPYEGLWEVSARLEDWTLGPFSPGFGGVLVKLKRTQG